MDPKIFFIRIVHTDDLSERVIARSALAQVTRQLTRQICAEYIVAIPSTAEQQKIADCLSSLDELIAAEGRKLDALKTHKKGLMQQLFPREGETQPRLRFPEFRRASGMWLACPMLLSFKKARESWLLIIAAKVCRLSGAQELLERQVTLEGCNYLDPDKVEHEMGAFSPRTQRPRYFNECDHWPHSSVTDAAAGAIYLHRADSVPLKL